MLLISWWKSKDASWHSAFSGYLNTIVGVATIIAAFYIWSHTYDQKHPAFEFFWTTKTFTI